MPYRSKHRADAKRLLRFRRIRLAALGMVLLLLIALPWYGTVHVQIDQKQLVLSDLPAETESIKIVYLSDLHAGDSMRDSRLAELFRMVNAQRPDLLLLGGDYGSDTESAIRFFQRAPKMIARYAIYGVLGERDQTDPDRVSELKSAMFHSGVIPLVNTKVEVRIPGGQLTVIGLDDALTGNPTVGALASSVRREDPVILLAHNPQLIRTAQLQNDSGGQSSWFDLGLFGHTHGPQLPLLGGALVDLSHIPNRYMRGWVQENRAQLLISRGVGTSGFPLRLFSAPQIHVITLIRK